MKFHWKIKSCNITAHVLKGYEVIALKTQSVWFQVMCHQTHYLYMHHYVTTLIAQGYIFHQKIYTCSCAGDNKNIKREKAVNFPLLYAIYHIFGRNVMKSLWIKFIPLICGWIDRILRQSKYTVTNETDF